MLDKTASGTGTSESPANVTLCWPSFCLALALGPPALGPFYTHFPAFYPKDLRSRFVREVLLLLFLDSGALNTPPSSSNSSSSSIESTDSAYDEAIDVRVYAELISDYLACGTTVPGKFFTAPSPSSFESFRKS